jgi:hypothetical protein
MHELVQTASVTRLVEICFVHQLVNQKILASEIEVELNSTDVADETIDETIDHKGSDEIILHVKDSLLYQLADGESYLALIIDKGREILSAYRERPIRPSPVHSEYSVRVNVASNLFLVEKHWVQNYLDQINTLI